MYRVAMLVALAVAVIVGVTAWAPTRSGAEAEPPGTPPALLTGEELTCDEHEWWEKDVRPPDPQASRVFPALLTPVPGGGIPAFDSRELYLVVITLPPGACMPYDAPGNQKKGAVIWMVEQGKVEFAWQLAEGAVPGGTPIVMRGDEATLDDATPVLDISNEPGEAEILYPGDWVTQDRQVAVTYTNVGGDSAIILKAVFAVPEGGGCSGDCR